MSETVMGLPAGYRTTFAKIMRILAMVTGTLIIVQFALAGFGAFGTFNKQKNWDPHVMLGYTIAGFTLLVLIAALIARPTRRAVIASIVMFVLAAVLQPVLAEAGKEHGAWWGALHVLSGLAIFATTGVVSRKIDAPPDNPTTPAAPATPAAAA